MKKMTNRFIALLMIFTSIISFLPARFGGQVAKAATSGSDATTIRVNITGSPYIPLKASTTNEKVYSYPGTVSGDVQFNLTVKDVRTSTDALKKLAKGDGTKAGNSTGITGQQVVLKTINSVALPDTAGILADMGISTAPIEGTDSTNNEQVVGQRITGLAYGINKVQYEVIVTTETVSYTPKYNSDGTVNVGVEGDYTDNKTTSQNTNPEALTIEYGTDFAINKISELKFKSYVGSTKDFDANDNVLVEKNNASPFLYTETAQPDPNLPLRYNFNVPDSTYMLKYVMGFKISLLEATIYRNGKIDNLSVTGEDTLQGTLTDMGASLIVLRIKAQEDGDNSPITRTYAIEINYQSLGSSSDYSLDNAGITKLYMNNDNTVDAYIGKKFTVGKDASGFPVYKGNITVDSRAKQISIDPSLIVPKAGLAYSVTNSYSDGTTTKVLQASLSGGDGKKYIDFQRGSVSNQLQIDVYKGDGYGNIADSSKILARYLLDVIVEKNGVATMDLAFDGSPAPYLRQPGVKDSILDFKTSRVTYDLCFGDPSVDQVPNTFRITYTGQPSGKNEYIKVFYSNSADGDNFTETQGSIDNNYDPTSLLRKNYVDVSVGNAQKIYVQLYYDDFKQQEVTDPSTGTKSTTSVLAGSYPAGDKYVFYLPNNYSKSTTPTPGETSNNASLNSLKVKGYTLTDTNGNTGFSSDVTDYTVIVAKGDTSAEITPIAQDDNIKSIVATINGSQETYDMYSGEESEIPLNTSGSTYIKIVVTAQDGKTTKTYNVLVTNNAKSSNANLKNVILSTGDYTFDPKQAVTKVRVDQNISTIKVTPIPEDSKAKITVKGEDYSSTPISVSLKGTQKTDVEIVVVSEDGMKSKTYTLEIYRVDASDWGGNSDNGGDQYDDDQFYDDYNNCWVDLTKYEEWGSVNGKPAYFDKNHRQVKEAWISTGGKYYYLNNLGYRASGWKLDNKTGQTYYLDPTTGEMKKGWMNLNNSWYYMGLNGLMHKGWLYLNGKWYFFTQNGQMVVNQSMYIDDQIYSFGQDGVAKY